MLNLAGLSISGETRRNKMANQTARFAHEIPKTKIGNKSKSR